MSTLRVDTILGESGAERRGLMTYAIICDEKAANVNGGTFTSGAWQTRNLNITIADPDSIVTIANDQFTLQAGSYLIEASAPAHDVGRHQARIYNATAASVVATGQNAFISINDTISSIAPVVGRVTVTSATAFEIQHRCSNTKSASGFGLDTDFDTSIYTVVKIFKEA
jgi:hypothetical protein